MARLLRYTRLLILLPIFGLTLAAALFFVLGGIGLVRLGMHILVSAVAVEAAESTHGTALVEVIEFVHTFLVGTVLYITAIGLYQLFIHPIEFHGWLKIESTDELETNLIGVTVVVLAVNFMGAVFVQDTESLLRYGAGIALPIGALGLFIAARAWAVRQGRGQHARHEHTQHAPEQPPGHAVETHQRELNAPVSPR
jgi:uncharacterized membrane protein YqhA